MSDLLSRVQILLDANTARFEQSMRAAQTTASTTFTRIVDGAKKMGPAVLAGGTVAAAALAAMTKEYVEAASEVTNFAEIAGASTTEFQKMAVGAKTLGFESEQLADIYKDVNEKLGEFTSLGSGGAADFFEQIAIKTEGGAAGARKLALEMQNLSGPQALQLYVDKAEQAGATTKQISFYLESLASDTTKLLPLLKNGGEGFKFWGEAAERAGAIMDETVIEKAGELEVQMDLLNLQVKGVKNQFIQGFIPAVNAVGESLSGATAETNLFSDAGETLGNVLKGVAAIALGVYASVKLVTNAVAGLAVDAVNAKNIIDSKKESNMMDFVPGFNLSKMAVLWGGIATSSSSATKMAMDDNSKIMEDVDSSITKLFDNTVSKAVQAMAESKKGMQGLNNGLKDWEDKQNKAAKSANKHDKAQKDLNNTLKEQGKLRESLIFEFADKSDQMKLEYEKKISEIHKAGFAPDYQSEFLNAANNRYQAEKDLYLSKLSYELTEYKLTEDEKLNFKQQLDLKDLKTRTDLNDSDRNEFMKHAQLKHENETQWLRLTQAQRLNDAQEAFQTEMQKLNSRYEFERKQIRLNMSLPSDEKNALIGASERSQDLEYEDRRRSAWNDFENAAGIDTSAEDAQSRRNEAFKQALEWQLITQDEYQKKLLDSEREYQADRASLAFNSGESIAGSFSDMFKTIGGEQSSAYKAMFAIEKGFAIAQSIMAIQTGIANAMSLPFPANLGAAATVAMETANIVSTIQSISLVGMAHDGLDNIPEEGTWLLDEGERVLSKRQNSDFTAFLDQQSKGEGSLSEKIQISQSIVFSDSGAKIDTKGQKQIAGSLNNAMDAWARKACGQGGVIFNFVRGR